MRGHMAHVHARPTAHVHSARQPRPDAHEARVHTARRPRPRDARRRARSFHEVAPALCSSLASIAVGCSASREAAKGKESVGRGSLESASRENAPLRVALLAAVAGCRRAEERAPLPAPARPSRRHLDDSGAATQSSRVFNLHGGYGLGFPIGFWSFWKYRPSCKLDSQSQELNVIVTTDPCAQLLIFDYNVKPLRLNDVFCQRRRSFICGSVLNS